MACYSEEGYFDSAKSKELVGVSQKHDTDLRWPIDVRQEKQRMDKVGREVFPRDLPGHQGVR